MRAVNLLPRDEAPKSFEKNRGVAFGAAGGAALITAVLCTMIIGAGGASREHNQTLDSLNAELAELPQGPTATANEDAALSAEKDARITALSSALSGRVAWDGVLRQVSQVLPEDVWLASLSTTAAVAGSGPEAVPAGLAIVGSTYSQSGVARFLARLSVLPALQNVTLESSLSTKSGTQRLVQFAIRAQVKVPGAST